MCPQHLFTCGLDQKEVRSVDDCIARLKLLDAKGRVWGQDMILQVKDGSLQLTDIETKVRRVRGPGNERSFQPDRSSSGFLYHETPEVYKLIMILIVISHSQCQTSHPVLCIFSILALGGWDTVQ